MARDDLLEPFDSTNVSSGDQGGGTAEVSGAHEVALLDF
jgi:hypothetical protein